MAQRTLPVWLLVGSVGIIVGVSMGRAQSMGLYLNPVTEALGTGREAFALSLALTHLLMGAGRALAGALIDRYGALQVVLGCLMMVVGGLWLLYVADSVADLLFSGVLLGLGVSGTGITSLVGVVGRMVPPHKRLAAIASIGMSAGIGGFLALPAVHLLIEFAGWQGSLLWMMAVVALLTPLAWPLRGRPDASSAGGAIPDQGLSEALREAFAYRDFWLLTAGFFVCGFHVAFIMAHLPAFAIDEGLAKWVGPAALSVVGIANIIGTWLAGQSGRFVEKRHALAFVYLGRSVLFLAILFVPLTPAVLIALCGALGLLWLATVPLTSAMVATFFGTRWMSMLFGIVFFSHQIGAFFGVWLGGRLFDATGSYDAVWWLSIALGLISAALNWPIRERPVPRLAGAST